MDINLCPKIHYVLYHNPPQYSSPPPANFVSHDRTLPNLHFIPTVLCVFVFVLFITVCVRITDVCVRITDVRVRITDVHIANSTSSSRFDNLSKPTRQPLYMGHFVYAYGAFNVPKSGISCTPMGQFVYLYQFSRVSISARKLHYIQKAIYQYPKSNLSISPHSPLQSKQILLILSKS